MKLSVDSSAFIKRYVEEPGTAEMNQLLETASELGLSVLLLPEIVSGLNRRRREGTLSAADYQRIKRQLTTDVRDAVLLQLTPSVIARAILLLEQNPLRALDALHLACAVEWGADLFATADLRQRDAASCAGLPNVLIPAPAGPALDPLQVNS